MPRKPSTKAAVPASNDHAALCKKHRAVNTCNSAPERCAWVKYKKCLPLSEDGKPIIPVSPAKAVASPKTTRSPPKTPVVSSAQHTAKCKKYRVIKACNESKDGCHWVPRLKCLPGRAGAESETKPQKRTTTSIPKVQKIQKQKVSPDEAWLAWYCKARAASRVSGPDGYCNGAKPRHLIEAKAVAINELSGKCIDMMDPITAEEFNESKPIDYLHSIVPIGEKERTGKQYCFDAPFMLDHIFQQMLLVRDTTTQSMGIVLNPMTNKPMSIHDMNAVIDANLALKKLSPTKSKPVYLSGISTSIDQRDDRQNHLVHNIKIIMLKCTGTPFTSLSIMENNTGRIRIISVGSVPNFNDKSFSPVIQGFSYGSLLEALSILVNHGRIYTGKSKASGSSLNTAFRTLGLMSFYNWTTVTGSMNGETVAKVYTAVKTELDDLVASSKETINLPAGFR